MSEEKTIEQLLAELKDAKKALETAMDQEQKDREEAQAIITKAENRTLNARQLYDGIANRIDNAMEKMQRESPEGTRWRAHLEAMEAGI